MDQCPNCKQPIISAYIGQQHACEVDPTKFDWDRVLARVALIPSPLWDSIFDEWYKKSLTKKLAS